MRPGGLREVLDYVAETRIAIDKQDVAGLEGPASFSGGEVATCAP